MARSSSQNFTETPELLIGLSEEMSSSSSSRVVLQQDGTSQRHAS